MTVWLVPGENQTANAGYGLFLVSVTYALLSGTPVSISSTVSLGRCIGLEGNVAREIVPYPPTAMASGSDESFTTSVGIPSRWI